MNRKTVAIGLALSCLISLCGGNSDAGTIPSGVPNATLLATGLDGGSGNAIGQSRGVPRHDISESNPQALFYRSFARMLVLPSNVYPIAYFNVT